MLRRFSLICLLCITYAKSTMTTAQASAAPRATSMVERFYEVRFLGLTFKRKSVEVHYTFAPCVGDAGETRVPEPMRLEERQVAPWSCV